MDREHATTEQVRPPGPERLSVLVVEDNPGDADLVRIALSERFAVHHVERLGEALAHLTTSDVDAVLLDLGLPDASGMECVESLTEAFPDLPVVVLTGNASAGLEAVRAGIQDYAVKGELTAHDLQRAIDYSIERNAHGQRVRELAKERAAHAATEAAAKKIEALFESMVDPVLVYGEDRRIESTNPAATSFFGRDVQGLLPAGLIDAADIRTSGGARIAVRSLPASRALAGEIVTGEKLRVRTSRGDRVVLVSASPVRRGDAVQGAVSVYRDVTALDSAEEALREADRNKSEFLTLLSHELRNPLAPILNALHTLRTDLDGADAGRARKVIERQVGTIARLVEDLLDISRISRGKIELRRGLVDLTALVRHIGEDHRGVAEQRRLELSVETPARTVWVDADATRLSQMIGNLLHNAHKFTSPGGRVTLALRGEHGTASVAVRDTGVGIEPDRLEHIFQPFYQAHGALARASGGLGLGLALVKGIAELHGGSVSAASGGSGHGAEFLVTLPIVDPPWEQAGALR